MEEEMIDPYTFNEAPIPFVTYDSDSEEFQINDDAFEMLKRIKSPMGIISVAGMYRTGKSYLLNRMLLNRKNGFGVGPTINPCTKGLWLWGSIIPGFTPEGEPLNVLVIDSEGIGALDEDSNHDTRIFSLAILLSSYFLYNSVGSIDESALNNLSLVINLTKHIHLKSQTGYDDIDPDSYSNYFPAFMWVVRDFTLQLVDEDGETISSKEYLEKALHPQKGFSDNVENKNRIRRLMKTFFKDRDCTTIVRPTTDEDKLQNLENIELEELRPEFVEQVMLLRRKVLNRCKAKTLNGKLLTGEMLCNLTQNYIAAINKGVVPNIENAWTYICKNECVKALHESLERYDLAIKDVLYNNLPVDEPELKQIHKQSKEFAVEEFVKKAVGNISDDYKKDLLLKIRQKYNTIRAENEKESRKSCQMFLTSSYICTEKKLKGNEFENFSSFERELRAFQHYFLENGPPGPSRRAILLEFSQRCLNEGAEYFMKNMENELNLQGILSQEMALKLENQVKEVKDEVMRERMTYTSKMTSLETAKAELSAKEQSLREDYGSLMKEKSQVERNMEEKIEEANCQHQRALVEVNTKLANKDENTKDFQRRLITAESDFEKQKALLDQKIHFMEKSLEDAKKKEKEYSQEIKSQKRDHSNGVKEVTGRYETQMKELGRKLEETTEKANEMESSLITLENKYDIEKQHWEEIETTLRGKVKEQMSDLQELRRTLECEQEKNRSNNQQKENDYKSKVLLQDEMISELERAVKNGEEKFKVHKGKWDKEAAILKQKVEFYEVQLSECKKQIEENKKAHESMIKAVENRDVENRVGKATLDKQIQEIQEIHMNEMKDLESQYEATRQRLSVQVDQLTERNSNLELQSKLQKADFDKEISSLSENIQTLSEENERICIASKSIESQKTQIMDETEKRYQEQLGNLEKQIEDKESQSQKEISDIQQKSEESLAQMKNFYEMEKERLEHRIIEEKEKIERKYGGQLEEYENRLKEEQASHSEEMDLLQEELREMEGQHQSIVNQYENELNLKEQKIESLQQYLKETKESLDRIQSLNNSALEQQVGMFNTERGNLLTKIEKLTHEVTTKERATTTLENKLDHIREDLTKKDKALDDIRQEFTSDKNSLIERLEQLKMKYQQISDEYMQKKLEFGRELALSKQHAEFQNKKIDELTKQNEDLMNRYEDKLKVQKDDHIQQINNTIEKMSVDKEISEKKYEQKRKALKELEKNINRHTAKMEREKAVLQEKLDHHETKHTDLESRYNDELTKLETHNKSLKDSVQKDKSGMSTEMENIRKQLQALEKEHSEVSSNYERDRALWEGRFKFLEEQKEQARADLHESQRKFEMTLEQLQKRGSNDKDKLEVNQKALMREMEQRFKTQAKELTEQHNYLQNELVQKNKSMEKELKTAHDKIQIEHHGKVNKEGTFEKKLTDFMEREKKLQEEIRDVKEERERKVTDYQRFMEKEKDTYKIKLQEVETKYKESEGKRSAMVFAFEQDRVKWALEKDHIENVRNEAQEMIEKLERKKDLQQKELDKLKSEKSTRRPFHAAANAVMFTSNSRFHPNGGRFHKENFQPGKFIGGDESYQKDVSEMIGSRKSSQRITGSSIGSQPSVEDEVNHY